MVKTIKFGWYCIKHAWRGCWTRANEQAGVVGGLVLAVLLYYFPPRFGGRGMIMAPETIWGTAALTVLMTIGSILLAFFLIFTTRLFLAPIRLYWEQRVRAEKLDQDLAKAVASQSELTDEGPNWPIHEVFSHLEPDVLNPAHERWEKVANELRDALSLGRLRIWGRLYKTELGEWIGERASLRPIDKTYWYKAFFTYLFFDETAGKAAHCYADRTNGVPAYTDLQVNRSEVQKLWPRELGVFVEHYPNVRVADNPSIHENILGGPDRQKFLALLSADKLSAWARPMYGPNDFVKIPATAWDTHKIDVHLHSGDSIDPDGVHHVHHQSFLKTKNKKETTHYDVALNRAQLKVVWPDFGL